MIELSTGICTTHEQAVADLRNIRDTLVSAADRLNVGLCGGDARVSAMERAADRRHAALSVHLRVVRLSSKQFTLSVSTSHGCPDPNSALYLLHSMSRFIPHFIALSASSPFVQGVDTGFDSAD